MVKCLALLTASAGVWLAVAAVVVAAPSRPAPQVKHTVGFIESLALDGSVVAYDVQGDQPHGPVCNRVYAWNIATRSVAKVSGAGTCGADDSSTGAGVFELAVAGSRIAWIANTGGLSESNDRLFTATLPRPHERKLASTLRTGDVDCVLTGRTLGGLVGSGDLLAYNIWAAAAANPGDEQSCATKITSGSLRRITAAATSPLRAGTDTLVAQDADGGRVAVLHADGTVELFSAAGKPLQTIGVDSAKGDRACREPPPRPHEDTSHSGVQHADGAAGRRLPRPARRRQPRCRGQHRRVRIGDRAPRHTADDREGLGRGNGAQEHRRRRSVQPRDCLRVQRVRARAQARDVPRRRQCRRHPRVAARLITAREIMATTETPDRRPCRAAGPAPAGR